jgi:hypothetical protein
VSGSAGVSASPSPSPSTIEWTTYTDVLGWTVDVPPGWTTQTWAHAGAGFSGDGITVEITRGGGALAHDDSAFPLDPKGFLFQGEGGLIGKFYGDGLPFGFVVLEDGTTLTSMTPAQKAAVYRMISSISFEPWHPREARHGLITVGEVLPAATAQWVEWAGQHYVAYYDGHGGRVLMGPVQACAGETFEIRMTGEAGITCSDGTTANWSFSTGAPAQGNGPNWDFPLATRPAVLSWDGDLLVRMNQVGS